MTDLTATYQRLTATQRAVLSDMMSADLRRARNGWLSPHGRRVSLATADALRGLGCVRTQAGNGPLRLVATGLGRQLAAVIEQRRRP